MFHAVENDELTVVKDSKIPMIFTIDRHDENVTLVNSFLSHDSLNLGLGFGESVCCEVRIEYSVGSS